MAEFSNYHGLAIALSSDIEVEAQHNKIPIEIRLKLVFAIERRNDEGTGCYFRKQKWQTAEPLNTEAVAR